MNILTANPAYVPISVLVSLGLVSIRADGQTFTSIMSEESSTSFSFVNGTANRTPAWTLQSPFAYPMTSVGAYDLSDYGYPLGNAYAAPPSWFAYTAGSPGGLYTVFDLTNAAPYRYPGYGQTSMLKTGVIGIRTKARFEGSGSGDGFFVEAIYFSERRDWAGQREFGFFRNVADENRIHFYWSTNSNCGIADNMGYPYCRTLQATGGQEYPPLAPLVAEHFEAAPIDNLDMTRQYVWVAYLFWAFWDSTYKFRVEIWDESYTTQIMGFNVDTILDTANFGASTSGMNGYITLAVQRRDPFSAVNSQLSVSSVETVR